jgi:hypothetical protein
MTSGRRRNGAGMGGTSPARTHDDSAPDSARVDRSRCNGRAMSTTMR